MKNVIKVAFLSSLTTAALVYVLLEWRPLQDERPRPPEVSWAAPGALPVASTVALPVAAGDDERNNIDIYQRYSPGVVNITSTIRALTWYRQPVQMEAGSGSGAIIDKQGHILTNFHVIEEALSSGGSLEVTLADKSKHPGKIIGYDAGNDLAVVKIDVNAAHLFPIPIGTSKGLQVGQKVLAIGNPFGLDGTLTTGIISARGRSIEARDGRIIEDIIQTDAAINPGNSGGPLLNSSGEIIGINTAIISPTNSGSVGIGFAIPADTVQRVVKDLITLGYVRRPALGVSSDGLVSLSEYDGLSEVLGLNTKGGLLVVSLVPGGPAVQAGIREANRQVRVGNLRVPVGGDVILAFAGREVNTIQELASAIDKQKPGDRVNITVLRGNQKLDVPVTLREAQAPRASR
jgi:putative serine protease PepD